MPNHSLEIKGPLSKNFEKILTPEACQFLEKLEQQFGARRIELLAKRQSIQEDINKGQLPDFLEQTRDIRQGNWKVGPIPTDLQDRRVEITGPVDRKMIINALNSGANAFMADLEDSHAPTWAGTIEGQINLYDAVRRTIEFTNAKGKKYELKPETATLIVRPRGWHLEEKNILLQGKPLSGSLVDFGLFFFHNAKELIQRGSGPYFYLPKLENHLEARLWNDVFLLAQKELDLSPGTIKATVLLETILASFEMDELLYELKDHCVGLNCGRWDYIFSYIKKFHKQPEFLVPDRASVTMTKPFLQAYSDLVIQTCHRRGAFAMGGMAAQIPIKNDPQANQVAMEKVEADKLREVKAGHDGTWVAHPGLVSVAREIFDAHMKTPNQVHVTRDDVNISAKDLLAVPDGTITEKGLRTNISVGTQYLEAWLRGNGCVPLYNLMEDAATAEISRAQVWQWIRHPKGVLEDGRKVTSELCHSILEEELAKIKASLGEAEFSKRRFQEASSIFEKIITSDTFTDFLTLEAYKVID